MNNAAIELERHLTRLVRDHLSRNFTEIPEKTCCNKPVVVCQKKPEYICPKCEKIFRLTVEIAEIVRCQAEIKVGSKVRFLSSKFCPSKAHLALNQAIGRVKEFQRNGEYVAIEFPYILLEVPIVACEAIED